MSTHPYLSNGFVAMAHRGGSLLPGNVGKENTLTAFEHAVSLGYRYLETDVHLTADGELVAFHDDRLDRVSDAHGLITDLTWADLQQVRVNGEPIPLFREVLDTFPGVNLNVDLKAPGAAAPLAALLADRDAFDRVCVGSFSSARLAEYRRLAGPRALTSSSRVEVVAQMAAGLVSLPAPGAAGAHQVPVRRAVAGRQVPVVTRGFVRGAHRAGRQVHVWTIDDPDQMHHLIDLGVDGIVSDAIDVLKRVLISRGLWTGR